MKASKIHGLTVQPSKAVAVVKPIVYQVAQEIRSSKTPEFAGALMNLTNWQARLVRGNLVDDRPPIWEDVPRAGVKRMLDERVNRHREQVESLNGLVPNFAKVWVDVETSQAKNLGPSSIFPSFLLDGDERLKAVYSDKPISSLSINHAAFVKALHDVETLLPAHSLRSTSIDAARPSSDVGASRSHLDGSTNSGYPAWISGWWKESRNDDTHREYRKWLRGEVEHFVTRCRKASSWEEVTPTFLATTGQRVVSKGPDPLKPNDMGWYKCRRFVIAMPKTETWPGKMLFTPMQEALLKVTNRLAPVRLMAGWVPKPQLDKNMQNLLEHAALHNRTVVSGDLSSFDASVPPEVWWKVKIAMSKWFHPDDARMFLAISYADIYNTGLISPTKIWTPQASSIKSGSIFTNVDDSIINFMINRYGYHAGYYGEPIMSVNGDDYVLDAPDLSPKGSEQAFADFGMTMNAEKAFYEKGCLHFLQNLFVRGLPGGMGSVYRVLTKCLAVEDDSQLRYDERNKYAYAVQALSRLENACFNPMFEQLVELIANGDKKFHLGRSLSPHAVASGAGDYAKRKFDSARRNVWSAGESVPFDYWACNRVLRGESLPPCGVQRWENIYRRRWSDAGI